MGGGLPNLVLSGQSLPFEDESGQTRLPIWPDSSSKGNRVAWFSPLLSQVVSEYDVRAIVAERPAHLANRLQIVISRSQASRRRWKRGSSCLGKVECLCVLPAQGVYVCVRQPGKHPLVQRTPGDHSQDLLLMAGKYRGLPLFAALAPAHLDDEAPLIVVRDVADGQPGQFGAAQAAGACKAEE